MRQTVLVVEDDEILAQVLSRVLATPTLEVCLASTMAQALEVAQERQPGAVLLDLCLPDGDGLQLARELRRAYPQLPLILMTAYPLKLFEDPDWSSLFVSLMVKPLNLSELRHTVAQALATPPATTTVRTAHAPA